MGFSQSYVSICFCLPRIAWIVIRAEESEGENEPIFIFSVELIEVHPLLFSVIIPAFNRKEFLFESIDSVLMQTCHEFEIIVVDDGSTDGTNAGLARYGDRIKVLRTERQGPGGARNVGAVNATGQFLSFLDSDDVWHPQTLEIVRGVLDRHGHSRIVFLTPLVFSGKPPEFVYDDTSTPSTMLYPDLLCGSPGSPPAGTALLAAINRHLFIKVGGFAPQMRNWEDVDLALRVGAGVPVAVVTNPRCVHYRKHDQQTSDHSTILYNGAKDLLLNERQGRYPGGAERRHDRDRWIAHIVGYSAMKLARHRHVGLAANLYRHVFRFLLREKMFRDLMRIPAAILLYGLKLVSLRATKEPLAVGNAPC